MSTQNRENKEISEQKISLETLDDQNRENKEISEQKLSLETLDDQNKENKKISEQELSLETLDDQIKQIEEEMQIKRKKLNAFKKRKRNLYKNAKKTKFVCSVCGKSLANKAALKHHEYNICGKEEWKCGLCDRVCQSQNRLDIHMNACRKRKCPMCNYRTGKYKQLKEHIKSGICTRLFKCHICFRELKSRNYLKTHYKKKHNFPPDEAEEFAYKDQNQT